MEERTNNHITVVSVLTLGCVGLIIKSIMEGWEFWMPPLLIAALVIMWVIHITEYPGERFRENYYLSYAMLGALYHGVHETSFFDIALVAIFIIIVFSVIDRINFLGFILTEYFVLMIVQIVLASYSGNVEFTFNDRSGIALQSVVVLVAFYICRKNMFLRTEMTGELVDMEERINNARSDMEDFLVNISHELRTPVNVVNGISTLMLKDEETEDVTAIRNAGIRLSREIENIQDYTEIKRGTVVIEEEQYAITSLINDLLYSFRIQEKKDRLEFVVDLDPLVPMMMKGDIKKLHKILRHLIDNSMNFTNEGGVYVRIASLKRPYGVNLEIEVTDTGIGMSRKDIANASKGLYQANGKRNRNIGGIGLGLSIVYGFVHKMKGFVAVDSIKGYGTTVRITVPQEVSDPSPCLRIDKNLAKNIIFHVTPEKYKVPRVREFYQDMAVSIASGLKLNLYSAVTTSDVDKILDRMEVSHIFTGSEEYESDPEYYDELSRKGIVVVVSTTTGFVRTNSKGVIFIPKPLYGFPITKILNEGTGAKNFEIFEEKNVPVLDGLRALIVDDEPMNLVVAAGLFKNYNMITDTAGSGQESLEKYSNNDYDIIFMDHMMPEMDGIEAMKRLKRIALDSGRRVKIVALTANAVSGAKQMFLSEGFDGFIGKPIDIGEFEKVMCNVLPHTVKEYAGGDH